MRVRKIWGMGKVNIEGDIVPVRQTAEETQDL